MKRTFIAVKVIPEEKLRNLFSSFKTVLKNESIKWTDPSNIHVTLVFLGDTEERRITESDLIMKEICTQFNSFHFSIAGAGIFKSFRDPRVIWAGIHETESLVRLYTLISGKLKETGSRLEERNFNPHLTLGRIKNLSDTETLRKLIEDYRDKPVQSIKVSEVIYYESILRPEGPIYKPLGIYSLLSR
jgi:2'-5' RNA ligase